MSSGGYTKLPDGSVVVALSLPRPPVEAEASTETSAEPAVKQAVKPAAGQAAEQAMGPAREAARQGRPATGPAHGGSTSPAVDAQGTQGAQSAAAALRPGRTAARLAPPPEPQAQVQPPSQPRQRQPEEEPRRWRWSAPADEARTVRVAARRPDEQRVRVLVHALNRSRALTRLRNLGLRSVYLHGNAEPPTPDEITAVLHHPEGLVWRAMPEDDRESWHPIAALLRPSAHRTRTA